MLADRDGVGVVVSRLRSRRAELQREIFVRVQEVVHDPVGDGDAEYEQGLRATVAAAVEYGLRGLERGRCGPPSSVPGEVVAQARRAARTGVSLDAVLRRYMVGNALLWDYVMQESERIQPASSDAGSGLRGALRVQSSLLDELVVVVAREYAGELEHPGSSREQRIGEMVRMLLAGGNVSATELDYDLDGEHVGVIATGAGCEQLLRRAAERLDRRLLSVKCGHDTAWAWLGGQRSLAMADLERALFAQTSRPRSPSSDRGSLEGVMCAVGEPARGIEGWRLTHAQGQAALSVALRRPRHFTRYADVALLAAALRDETLARSLIAVYLAPLGDARDGGEVLRGTLRAYLASERNASSAAVMLRVARSTVENRLRTIEERLGRSLRQCPAELEVALHLDDLGVSLAAADRTGTHNCV